MSALQLEGCLFHCGLSNFYYGDHKLTVHVHRGTGICHLILYDLGIFKVPLDVQSLEKLENLPVFGLCFYLWLISIDQFGFYTFRAKGFFSENVAVNVYPVNVVARVFE